ncbi:hypothetical protein B4166_3405 [Caldibacillus thermoamylovorans]|nr:hypothetical protein B4166_3405 [Caldibacillus thermoamylovorans]
MINIYASMNKPPFLLKNVKAFSVHPKYTKKYFTNQLLL